MKKQVQTLKKVYFPPYTTSDTVALAATIVLIFGIVFSISYFDQQKNLNTQAAATTVHEAESGTRGGNASIVTNASASAGQYVVFSSLRPISPCTGPVVTVTGIATVQYVNNSPAAGTTFNLNGWNSTAVTGPGSGKAFSTGFTTVPLDSCVLGGLVKGSISDSLNWDEVHDIVGGWAFRTITSGLAYLDGARIHNVEDGWKPRECPPVEDSCGTFTNQGRMHMRNVYMTYIRDNAVEDDDFMPGVIEDSLIDGTFDFLSEQYQSGGTNSIGPTEDTNIYINRVIVRLSQTNAAGSNLVGGFFKYPGAVPHHTPIITDSVLALDQPPSNTLGETRWGVLNFPAGTEFRGTNYLLWLGTGTYGGPKPAGVIFMEGQAAKDKFAQVRNEWLVSHGYAPLATDDFNYRDDPVVAPNF